MRYILILLLFTSCYTKKGCEKFCRTDSTTVVIRDTIRIDSIHTDTVFNESVDTVVIYKDKLTIKYIKVKDKIYLSGTVNADTIYREKTIYLQTKQPIQTWWQLVKSCREWLLIAFILGFIICAYLRFGNK